jgi:hypothetical protein
MRWAPSLEEAAHLFERHPIEQVGYTHIGHHVRELADSPFLERLRGLDLGHIGYPLPILRDVFCSSRLGGLRRLTGLLLPQGTTPVEFLGNLPITPHLTELGVSHFTDESLVSLLDHTAFAGLNALVLGDRLTGRTLRMLLAPGRAERWSKLHLNVDDGLPVSNWRQLERCSQLKELFVSWPAELPAGGARLSAGLERLRIFTAHQGCRFLPELGRQDCLGGLRELDISVWSDDTLADDEDWNALGEVLARLSGPVLDLSSHSGPPDALARLSRLPDLHHVARLDLHDQVFSDDDLARFCERDDLTGLRSLHLGCEALSLEQVRWLAEAPLMDRLESLSLFQVRLADEAVEVLLASSRLRRLTSLDLGSTGIGGQAVAALAKWPGLARLRRLMLWFNKIDAGGIAPLLTAPGLRALVQLELEENARRGRRLRRSDVLPTLQRLGNRLSI